MSNHRERRQRPQGAVRRRARQALRLRACDEAGLDEAMEFVTRPDEKRTQPRAIRKKWEVSAWDEGAGRRHEGVESRDLRPVEVEEQDIVGLLDQKRVTRSEIFLATAACHQSDQQLPAGLAIDLMAGAR